MCRPVIGVVTVPACCGRAGGTIQQVAQAASTLESVTGTARSRRRHRPGPRKCAPCAGVTWPLHGLHPSALSHTRRRKGLRANPHRRSVAIRQRRTLEERHRAVQVFLHGQARSLRGLYDDAISQYWDITPIAMRGHSAFHTP